MKREKTIPSILGLVMLLTTLFGGSYFVSKKTSLQSNASETCDPKSLMVSNVSPAGFDVFFTSDKTCEADLKLADLIFRDSRQASQLASKNHYFKATNLKPDTEYKLELITGGEVVDAQKTIKTYPANTAKTNGDSLAWGKVFKSDKLPAKGAILYLEIPGAGVFSSFVTDSGNWSVPASTAYYLTGTSLYKFPSTPSPEDIKVIDSNGKTSTFSSTTDNNQPVPDIYLDTPDFIIPKFTVSTGSTTTSGMGGADKSGSLDTIFDPNITTVPSDSLLITYPKESEKIGNPKPEFFGKAKPNSQIIISLTGPSTKNGSVISSSAGDWKWSPDSALSLGTYNLKVEQSIKAVLVKFSISSEESSLAFVSTPSANVTVPPSPTPLVSTPTPQPTPASVQPTVKPTERPITPTPVPKVMPKSGGTRETIILITAGLVTTLLGGLFLRQP